MPAQHALLPGDVRLAQGVLRPVYSAGERELAEIGQRSARGCASSPWDAWTESPRDAQEQADYMEAVFRTFGDKPQWAGLFWWKWDETQKRDHFDPDPAKDRGFRIYGKPACDVFRRWSGRG